MLYAKAEFLNPSGSIKDRLAVTIIDERASYREQTVDTGGPS